MENICDVVPKFVNGLKCIFGTVSITKKYETVSSIIECRGRNSQNTTMPDCVQPGKSAETKKKMNICEACSVDYSYAQTGN